MSERLELGLLKGKTKQLEAEVRGEKELNGVENYGAPYKDTADPDDRLFACAVGYLSFGDLLSFKVSEVLQCSVLFLFSRLSLFFSPGDLISVQTSGERFPL